MKLPVTVIGGYLGAGKTTLVNHLLRHADGKRLAVLVNEFGALPIDQDLIEAQDDNIISIAGGCVCCSYGNDLVQAMIDLTKLDPMPDHVLLEASGVAMPGAIAGSISLLPNYQLDGVIVLADAETIRKQAADEYVGDTIERQLIDADIVLLNKTDLLPKDAVTETVKWLETKTNSSAIVTTRHSAVSIDVLLQPMPSCNASDRGRDPSHTNLFETKFLEIGATVDADAVGAALADVSLGLIRAKGFVKTPHGLRTVQVVGRRWAVSEAPEKASAGIVVIAAKSTLDIAAIQQAVAGI